MFDCRTHNKNSKPARGYAKPCLFEMTGQYIMLGLCCVYDIESTFKTSCGFPRKSPWRDAITWDPQRPDRLKQTTNYWSLNLYHSYCLWPVVCVCVGLRIEKLPELVQRMMVKLKFCDSWDKDNWNFDSTFCWLGPIPFDFSSCKYHQRWLFVESTRVKSLYMAWVLQYLPHQLYSPCMGLFV